MSSIVFIVFLLSSLASHNEFIFSIDRAHHDMFINDGYRDEELEKALHAHARMGYNFMITKVGVIYPDSFSETASVQIDVKIDQVGVAPFYYPLSLFLDCPDMGSPMEVSGIESLISEGDSKVVSFRNVPPTPRCMNAVQLYLNSTQYGYRNRPIKFAQGENGVVKLRIPLPSALLADLDVDNDPYVVVYNLINVNANVGISVAEVKSGASIDLARVGRAITIQIDFYGSNLELRNENVTVEFRFNGRVHYERRHPFLLAGHRGDTFSRSLYLSTTGNKSVQTIVYDKRDKSILLNQTISFTIVDTTQHVDSLSRVPVPAPMMTRTMGEVFAKFLFVTNTPTISPVRDDIDPTMNYLSDNSIEIHGFNTPSSPPLMMLEDRQRRMEFWYHVIVPTVSAFVLVLLVSAFLLYRRPTVKRIHGMNHRLDERAHDGLYKNPI